MAAVGQRAEARRPADNQEPVDLQRNQRTERDAVLLRIEQDRPGVAAARALDIHFICSVGNGIPMIAIFHQVADRKHIFGGKVTRFPNVQLRGGAGKGDVAERLVATFQPFDNERSFFLADPQPVRHRCGIKRVDPVDLHGIDQGRSVFLAADVDGCAF